MPLNFTREAGDGQIGPYGRQRSGGRVRPVERLQIEPGANATSRGCLGPGPDAIQETAPAQDRAHLPIERNAGSKPAPSVTNERSRFVARASSLQPVQPGMAALRSESPTIGRCAPWGRRWPLPPTSPAGRAAKIRSRRGRASSRRSSTSESRPQDSPPSESRGCRCCPSAPRSARYRVGTPWRPTTH